MVDRDVDLIWTLLIKGGMEVSFNGQGTVQYHDGIQSIWKLRGTRDEIDEVVATAESIGCDVTVFGEGQTEEQKTIRLRLLEGKDEDQDEDEPQRFD